MGPAEEDGGPLDVPLEQELADLGRGHDEAVGRDRLDDVEQHAVAGDERPERQKYGVAMFEYLLKNDKVPADELRRA